MKITIDIPNPPKKQSIINVPIHFCGGQVVDAGGYGFEVLPKGHGRLIDADALKTAYGLDCATKYGNESKEQQANSYDTMMMYEIADMLDYAPTVIEIEADKEVDE